MITVGKLLEQKGIEVWNTSPDSTVYSAIVLMRDKGVGALAVTVQNKLVGMLSERDYARKIILQNRTSRETKVREIMTNHVFYTHKDQTIDECLVTMNEKRIRHLPVLEEQILIGMISMGDVVKQIISDQQYTIRQLQNYISWEESY